LTIRYPDNIQFFKITSLQPGSSAAEKLAIGDRIMAVNAHEVTTQVVIFIKYW